MLYKVRQGSDIFEDNPELVAIPEFAKLTDRQMIEEVWYPVVGYEGMYDVSNMGRVRSYYRETLVIKTNGAKPYIRITEGRIMKVGLCMGYLVVGLSDADGNRVTRRIHRLVAQAFIPNPENKPEVNHIDGNKQNNKLSNLEWVTSSENKKHAVRTGLSRIVVTEKTIESIRKRSTGANNHLFRGYYCIEGIFYESSTEVAKAYGIHRDTVRQRVKSKNPLFKNWMRE